MSLILLAAFLWICGCLLVTVLLLRKQPVITLSCFWILAISLGLRAVPALMLPVGAAYEMHVFREAALLTLAGKSVYMSEIAHDYPPLQLYWAAAAEWVASQGILSFIPLLKVVNVVADVALTLLVYRAVLRRHPAAAPLAGLVYAVNPVSILVVSYQGQFDAVPLVLLVLAWYLLSTAPQTAQRITLSALALGFGILAKTWPGIFLPIALFRILGWSRRAGYAVLAFAVPVLGVALYALLFPGSLNPMWYRISHNTGAISGWWGFSAILSALIAVSSSWAWLFAPLTGLGKILGYTGGLLAILGTRRQSMLSSLLLTILTMFAFIPNLGVQGLSWVIPLAVILMRWRPLLWYSVGATLHMIVAYWGLHLTDGLLYTYLPQRTAEVIIQLSSLTIWLVIVIWVSRDWLDLLQSGAWKPAARQQSEIQGTDNVNREFR